MKLKIILFIFLFIGLTSFASAKVNITDPGVLFNTSDRNVTYRFLNDITELDNVTINSTHFIFFGNGFNETFTYTESSQTLYNLTALELNSSFYDESTNKLINFTNITTEVTIENGSIIFITDNGTFSLKDVIVNEGLEFLFVYVADGYDKRAYPLQAQLGEINLKLFLLNSTLSTDITCNVFDIVGQGLEGYNVRVQRLINGNYEEVEVSKSNFEGKSVISAETFTPFYKFVIEKDGVIYKSTTETEITSSTLNFFINLGQNLIERYSKSADLQYTFLYNNNTKQFQLDYVDPTNSVSEVCMKVYKQTNYTAESLYNETCLNSASGTINILITEDIGSTYTARIYASYSPEQYIDVLIESFANILDLNNIQSKRAGVWVTIIIELSFAFVGFWNPPLALILVSFGLWVTRVIGLHLINYAVITGVTVGFFVLAYLLGRNQ